MGRLIYPDVGDCRALVIDSNPTSRSILTGMLREFGVGHVSQTSRAADARRALENRVYDIVLCDYHFDNSPLSGQDLLDDLRRAHLLPYSTVFVMVTGESAYTHVAEAAESALDSYLLKPHAASALEARLLQARHRKKVLRSIFEAIEDGEFSAAAALCMERFDQRSEYWLYAARVGAELFLRLADHAAAKTLYEAVQASKALPWARLGLARVELESGQVGNATRTLESLIADQPSYADAYDVMGRVQVDQGNLDAALETYRSAAKITPHSIGRLQKQGMLAFYMGNTDEAAQALERTVRIGISSKMFDCQTLVLLALLHFEKRDGKALGGVVSNLALAYERRPESRRLKRFLDVGTVLQRLFERKVADVVNLVRELAAELRHEDFDFEAASNMLALLSRLHATEIKLEAAEDWVGVIARRFCVSKSSTEMLCKAAQGHEAYSALIREGLVSINGLAEKAISHSVTGSPDAAARSLLEKGGETLNGKLIELAAGVLLRHAAKIADAAELTASVQALKLKFCTKGTQVGLGQSTGRTAGGLNLRAPEPAAARA